MFQSGKDADFVGSWDTESETEAMPIRACEVEAATICFEPSCF